MAHQGLVLIYTGNGKGKTTAAFGQALRAAGHGQKVCIIQFIKEKKDTGEAKAIAALAGQVDLHIAGSGFSWQQKDMAEFKEAALGGWELACEKIRRGGYGMVILDELTYLITFHILPETAVLDVLAKRPPQQHVVITGRQASAGLLAAADLVTEMRKIKHPYQKGVAAQKGIEF